MKIWQLHGHYRIGYFLPPQHWICLLSSAPVECERPLLAHDVGEHAPEAEAPRQRPALHLEPPRHRLQRERQQLRAPQQLSGLCSFRTRERAVKVG